jgi:hypothetical protein
MYGTYVVSRENFGTTWYGIFYHAIYGGARSYGTYHTYIHTYIHADYRATTDSSCSTQEFRWKVSCFAWS